MRYLSALACRHLFVLSMTISGLSCARPSEPNPPDPVDLAAAPEAPSPLKNLLFIVLDTQRADRLRLYGGHVSTPQLEHLASRGVVYDQAHSHAPITGPSHASMFTGLAPNRHGLHNNGQVLGQWVDTIAEGMRTSGRATAAFVSLQAMAGRFGFSQGFDSYDVRSEKRWWITAQEVNQHALPWLKAHSGEPFFVFIHYSDPHEPYLPPSQYQSISAQCGDGESQELSVDGRRMYLQGTFTRRTVRCVLTLAGAKRARFHHFQVDPGVSVRLQEGFTLRDGQRDPTAAGSTTLSPDEPATLVIRGTGNVRGKPFSVRFSGGLVLEQEDIRTYYDLETQAADQALAALWQVMTENQLWEQTLVVFTADHGEELLEEPGIRGHIHRLRETVLHVPLIVAAPNHLRAGEREPRLVSHIDLWPTLAPMLGLPPRAGPEGRDLRSDFSARPHLAFTFQPQARQDLISAQLQELKLVRQTRSGQEQAFDLRADPLERKPLDEQGQRAFARELQQLRLAADQAQATLPQQMPSTYELSETDREGLRALGYLVPESKTQRQVEGGSATAREPSKSTISEGRDRVGPAERMP